MMRESQRVKPGQVEGLISINVAQAGQESLVQEERFQLAAVGVQTLVEILGGKLRIERFRTKITQDRLWVRNQPDTPEFTGVVERQAQAVFQAEDQAMVEQQRIAGGLQEQVTAHSQVNEQEVASELEDDKFSPAADIHKGLAYRARSEFFY